MGWVHRVQSQNFHFILGIYLNTAGAKPLGKYDCRLPPIFKARAYKNVLTYWENLGKEYNLNLTGRSNYLMMLPRSFANQTKVNGKRHFECELKSSRGMFSDEHFVHNFQMEKKNDMFLVGARLPYSFQNDGNQTRH